MKCMICGAKTLPSTRLCKPCRAALRRARDDTISELMPLPRRMDLAVSHVRSASPRSPIIDVGVERDASPAWRTLLPATPPARLVGVGLLALAVGGLAFVSTYQIRQGRSAAEKHAQQSLPVAGANEPRVSPATLAAAARESAAAEPRTLESEPASLVVQGPAAAGTQSRTGAPKPRRMSVAPLPQAAPAPLAALGPVVEPPAPPLATPTAAPAAPKLDRWQSLSAALARCANADPFSRSACEHAARQAHCDGEWGMHSMCTVGVVNDHGQ